MASKIQLRRDTAAQWSAVNPILGDGEVCIERDTKRFKIGDGVSRWNSLTYSSVTLAENPVNTVRSQTTTSITYDVFKRLDVITYSDGNKAQYVYLPSGLVQKIVYTDAGGVIDVCELVFTYDVDGRITSEAVNIL